MSSIRDVTQLEDRLSAPTEAVVETLGRLDGDIIILGAGGKMGPSLARMTKRAGLAAGSERRVIAVSRFSNVQLEQSLAAHGVETIRGDLLDASFVESLPSVPNVVSLVGLKFGTTGAETVTWATNTYLPSLVARRYATSRIVALSTGNVYSPVAIEPGTGSLETDSLDPLGEYAMSCLGRERIFEYFSETVGTRISLLRLNYAVEMRYGVLVDLARKVLAEEPVPLATGYANVIWQADANAYVLCALAETASPPFVLNISGPERLCCRDVAHRFGELMGKTVRFTGSEAPTAMLSDARRAFDLFGPPHVGLDELIAWTADWLIRGQPTWDKPTHFETTDGKF